MTERDRMDATYDLHAQVLKVLADPRRLEIVHLLGTGPRDASSLAKGLSTDRDSTCGHLSALIAAGLVEPRDRNGMVSYELSDPDVMAACELLRGVLRRRLDSSGAWAPSAGCVE